MRRARWIGAAVALAAGGGLAGVLGALPAVGQASPPSSPVIMGTTAKLIARGVGAKPYAYVVCRPGDFAQLSISLAERVNGHIAAGSGYVETVPCNGLIETIHVPVMARNVPFAAGTALGQASFFDCGPGFCNSVTSTRLVKLHK